MSSTLSGGSCGSSMRPPFLFTTRKCVTPGPPCLIFWMRASARLSSFGIDGYQYVTPPRNVPTSQKRPPSPSARRKRVAMLALSLMQFSSSILPVPFAHSPRVVYLLHRQIFSRLVFGYETAGAENIRPSVSLFCILDYFV